MKFYNIFSQTDSLKKNFQLASTYLKEHFSSAHHSQNPLPWYLVLGPSQSGKTTLLAQSELTFSATDQFVQRVTDDTFSSTNCNWWFNEQGVFLDVPGHFVSTQAHQATATWTRLLKLIKRQSQYYPLKGILFVISAYDLAAGKVAFDEIDNIQKKLLSLH